jgi:hypothetical protein
MLVREKQKKLRSDIYALRVVVVYNKKNNGEISVVCSSKVPWTYSALLQNSKSSTKAPVSRIIDWGRETEKQNKTAAVCLV